MNKQKLVNKKNIPCKNLKYLMDMLANKDGMSRQTARQSLVAIGKPAVSSLARTLQNSRLDHVRWEAAKILGAIGDIRSIPSLIKALEDRDQDVAWLAAEALRKFKKEAWSPILRRLIKRRSDSDLLRQGVYHIMRNQKEDGFNDLLATLRKALKSGTAQESALLAANDILKRMKTKS
jgi:HEAT repeat protein